MIDRIDKYLNESMQFKMQDYWQDPVIKKGTQQIAQKLDYDIYGSAAFAIELLTQVNFHGAAAVLERFVKKEYTKTAGGTYTTSD